MSKHFYPALFLVENDGITVTFPDVPEAITFGANFEEAYEMASDALGLALETTAGVFDFPAASELKDIKTEENQYVVMYRFDEIEYMKRNGSASVKKTLTIPQWLNTLAVNRNINFSQTLQDALREKLNIN